MSSTGVEFRELDWNNTSEVGLVYKSWLGSYKNHAVDIPYSMYRDLYQGLLDRLLKRDGCVVILAYHPEYPDQIFGFAALERNSATLHYMYVKADYRRKGIGADLLEFILADNTSFDFTTKTRLGWKYLKSRGGNYKPRFIRNELP